MAHPPRPPGVSAAKADDSLDFLAPPQKPDELGRLGSYRVLRVLGRGGMGMVFLAHDPGLDRRVALKVMLPGIAANPAAKQRFLREARAAANLRNDHIVHIYQVGEERGVPFLAMELLEGMPLDEYLRSGRQLKVPQILRIGREVARGLAAAHDKNLVHRDIKPGNLWLDNMNSGRVKILDFGLARSQLDDVQLTQSGAIVGTPAYMAPEQARGDKGTDARADLFSLGCVLYRLATGVVPFKGDNTIAVLLALATHDPTPPYLVNQALPPPLSELIMRLLEKDAVKRPASAQEVISRLADIEKDTTTRRYDQAEVTAAFVGQTAATAPALPTMDFPASTIDQAPKKNKPHFSRWQMIAAAAVGFAALLAAGVVYFMQTPNGKVEVTDGTKSRGPRQLPASKSPVTATMPQSPDLGMAKVLYQDNFKNAASGWRQPKNPHHVLGYDQDGLVVRCQTGWAVAACPAGPFSDFACQVEARFESPASGQWGIQIANREENGLVNFKLNGEQELTIEAIQPIEAARQFKTLGPIWHPCIKPGNQLNKLLVIWQKNLVEVYVNDIAVCEPFMLDIVKTPISLGLYAHSPPTAPATPVRAHFSSFAVWSADSLPTLELRRK